MATCTYLYMHRIIFRPKCDNDHQHCLSIRITAPQTKGEKVSVKGMGQKSHTHQQGCGPVLSRM